MGLDIYFFKTKVKNFEKFEEDYNNNPSEDEYFDVSKYNFEGIGYFRKVNFLMYFFAYYGNEEYKKINKDELMELQERCVKVLEYRDEDISKHLLETCGGFFFGSTEYDDMYYTDVKYVLEWVKKVLYELTDDDVVLMFCDW